MTRFFKSNPEFDISIFNNKDIIHDDNIQFFHHDNEPSYIIENFINQKEQKVLHEFFLKEYEKSGENINNKVIHLIHPIRYSLIKDMLLDRLKAYLGNDIIFYSDVSDDPISVGDQFFKIARPYAPHTDSVTHIPGYRPYKDIIIPIAVDNPNSSVYYYTCNQRYKSRASHFQRGWDNRYFPNYANVLREHAYEKYGVEDVEYDAIPEKWFEDHLPNAFPRSVFSGLSIEQTHRWIPGNAIVQDASTIHGSGNFLKTGVKWKIGLTFHLLKKDSTYGTEVNGSYYTKFSKYTNPMIELSDPAH